ncbi:MAG: phospholipase C [Polyangiaceae bacterium]
MTSGPRARALLFAILISVALLMALASACGSNTASPVQPGGHDGGDAMVSEDAGTEDANGEDAADELLAPPNISRDAGEAILAPMRQACAFEAGAWPAQTIGNEYPLGSDIPIKHIIVIMQENRSFDHYLGRLVAQGYYQPGDFTVVPDGGVVTDSGTTADAATDAAGDDGGEDGGAPTNDAGSPPTVDAGVPGSGFSNSNQLDVLPPGWSNPDGDGGIIVPHPDDEYCYGVGHSWENQHNDWDNGKNDNFVITNNPDGERTFFYEDDTVIPFYYALASTFSVGDRYFCSVLSSTWPNRYFLMAATSFGIGDNSACTLDTVANPAPQIFNLLVAGGHTWKDYTDGPHMEEFFPNFGFNPTTIAHYGTADCTLFADIQKGTLPDVSFMMGDEVTETSDEGPSDLPGIGGQVVEAIIRALWASSSWADTAVFITYDENGGIADHVPPAPACEPDGYPPHDGSGNSLPGAFNTTGFRVPFIVVSPYAKAHFASHTVHDHTSITRFIEAKFGLPALTARDANATPPFEMFDFQNPPFMTPPTIAAHTTVPQSILTQCSQSLAPTSCPSQ